MQLIHPDVLASARGLSVGAAGFAALVGVLLWALGWRWHRFWVVFGMTLVAGVIGLNAGKTAGGQVLVVGVLLAVTAGLLALELARILAFASGGVAAWAAAQAAVPQAQELWAVFLCGGLLGVVLYRLWTMLTTSFVGTVIAGHAWLVLAEAVGVSDVAGFAATHAAAINGVILTTVFVGVLVQAKTAEGEPAAAGAEPAEPKDKNAKKKVEPPADEPAAAGWWRRPFGRAAA